MIFRCKESSANLWFFDLASTVLRLPIGPMHAHFPTHPMTPMERVLAKLEWLKKWLRTEAPELNKLPSKFVWLLTNTENNPNDRRRRAQAAEKKLLIRVQGTLHLSKF